MGGDLPGSSGDAGFATTDWGLITAAVGGNSPTARRAMADLCAIYWYPLYAYIRRQGHPADRAEDLAQGLFASLLGRDFLGALGPDKGRFRAFLLASCRNFLSNRRDHDRALKRGGGSFVLPIDLPEAEGRYAVEPSHGLTAERLFERQWALTLLGRALDRLAGEMADKGKGPLFDRLKPTLLGDGSAAPNARLAEELSMTEAAVKKAAQRLRLRYGELVREEVLRTVERAEDIDDEIRGLFAALGR